MTDEQIKAIVEEMGPQITASLKERVRDSITKNLEYQLASAVSGVVAKFIETDLAPVVREHLLAEKDGLVKIAKAASSHAGEALTAAMMKSFEEKVGNSWQREAMIKAMF